MMTGGRWLVELAPETPGPALGWERDPPRVEPGIPPREESWCGPLPNGSQQPCHPIPRQAIQPPNCGRVARALAAMAVPKGDPPIIAPLDAVGRRRTGERPNLPTGRLREVPFPLRVWPMPLQERRPSGSKRNRPCECRRVLGRCRRRACTGPQKEEVGLWTRVKDRGLFTRRTARNGWRGSQSSEG